MTFIELSANQIVLDPQIIRKTMQALKEGKSSVGLIQDDRKQIDLRINPDIAFNQLQVDPPISYATGKMVKDWYGDEIYWTL